MAVHYEQEKGEKGTSCQLIIMQILSEIWNKFCIPPPYPSNGIVHKQVLQFFSIS